MISGYVQFNLKISVELAELLVFKYTNILFLICNCWQIYFTVETENFPLHRLLPCVILSHFHFRMKPLTILILGGFVFAKRLIFSSPKLESEKEITGILFNITMIMTAGLICVPLTLYGLS